MKTTLIAVLAIIIAISLYSFITQRQAEKTSAETAQKIVQLTDEESVTFRQVDPSFVCMNDDELFGIPQIPITIDDKTYYGCSSNCEQTLNKLPSARVAIDPVSGNEVDKATAVIGADESDEIYYFENQTNLLEFSKSREE